MQQIQGNVQSVDAQGNLVTDITAESLAEAPRDDRLRVSYDEHETCGLFQCYEEQPALTLVAVLNPQGLLELGIVQENAQIMLGAKVGSPVVVKWE